MSTKDAPSGMEDARAAQGGMLTLMGAPGKPCLLLLLCSNGSD